LLRPPALCFPQLQPASFRSFLAAAPRLSDAHALSSIRADLPIYLFSASEDPVAYSGKASELSSGASAEAGLYDISHDFYRDGRHEMLNETNREEVLANLLNWLCAQLTRQKAEEPREKPHERQIR